MPAKRIISFRKISLVSLTSLMTKPAELSSMYRTRYCRSSFKGSFDCNWFTNAGMFWHLDVKSAPAEHSRRLNLASARWMQRCMLILNSEPVATVLPHVPRRNQMEGGRHSSLSLQEANIRIQTSKQTLNPKPSSLSLRPRSLNTRTRMTGMTTTKNKEKRRSRG